MAFTSADVDSLKAALATGALRVRFADGRDVTYRSLTEIRDILKMATADANGGAAPRLHSVAGF